MTYYLKHTVTTVLGDGADNLIKFAMFYGPFTSGEQAADRLTEVTGGKPDMDEWELWGVDDEFPVPGVKNE